MKPERERIFVEGLIAGAIGYAGVALFFAAVNVIAGHSPFYTPALLGEALFYGLADPTQVVIEPGPILAYNGVHLIAFLLLGTVAAALVFEIEHHPQLFYAVFFLALAFVLLTYGMLLALATPIASAFPWWAVGGANLLAAVGMGGYLWFVHPRLREEVRRQDRLEELEAIVPRT
ncbi:MAG: hypothetical protein HY561_08135 [Gemmatimonadetes bacterium]|nr:hypothetical protein [Gemmatimonadota bacterium]